MPRRRPGGSLAAVLALCLTALGLTSFAPSAPASATPTTCRPTAHPGIEVAFTGPAGGRVQLGRTPRFALTGTVHGPGLDTLTGVDLFADGLLLGRATLAPAGASDRSWTFTTSAPAGTHAVVACARTSARGRAASTPLVLTVVRPGPHATVVSPDVHTLTAAETLALTAVEPSRLTFARPPRLAVGSIVAAGPSPRARSGLLRRVTALGQVGSTTVVGTAPAAITDAVWQGRLQATDRPVAAHWATTVEADPQWLDSPAAPPVEAAGDPAGSRGWSTLAADLDVRASGTLDVDLVLTPRWQWAQAPEVSVSGRVDLVERVEAALDVDLVATIWHGRGVTTNTAAQPSGPVQLSADPPLWVTPVTSLALDIDTESSNDLVTSVTTVDEATLSARLGPSPDLVAWHELSGTATGFNDGAAYGPEGTAQVVARTTTSLRLEDADLLAFGAGSGIVATDPGGCEVRRTLDVVGRATLEAIRLPGTELTEPVVRDGHGPQLAEHVHPYPCDHGGSGGVTGQVRYVRLRTLAVGEEVATQLYGVDGDPTWAGYDLPPGLTIDDSGIIAGAPTEPGEYLFTVVAAGQEDDVVSGQIALTVTQPGAFVAASAPGDPIEVDGVSDTAWANAGHSGCVQVGDDGVCFGGDWSNLGVPWIWGGESDCCGVDAVATKVLDVGADQGGTYLLTALMDDEGTAQLDGVSVLSAGGGDAWSVPRTARLTLAPGRHELRFVVHNTGGPGGLSWTLTPTSAS